MSSVCPRVRLCVPCVSRLPPASFYLSRLPPPGRPQGDPSSSRSSSSSCLVDPQGHTEAKKMILSRQPATSSTLRVTNPSSQRSQHLTGSFTLQDVCVVFFNSTKASYRAQFVSRRGERAIIHGFSERQFGFHRVATVRPAVANEYEALARCEQQPHAIAIYYSANNFFHQAFHAIPAWEGLHAVAGSAAAVMIPLVGGNAGDWFAGRSLPSAWEYTIRSLTALAPSSLAESLRRLLDVPCTCFSRVDGNVGAFSLFADQQRYVSMTRGWRQAALWNAHFLAKATLGAVALQPDVKAHADSVIYVARVRGSRCITNEADFVRALSIQVGFVRLRRAIMELMPLSEQMLMLSSARVVIGVHGQALSLMTFMPWDTARTAMVEIIPRANKQAWTFQAIFVDWARALGVRYHSSLAEPVCKPLSSLRTAGEEANRGRAARTHCTTCSLLNCNVTVHVEAVISLVARAMNFTAAQPQAELRTSSN